MGWLRGWEWVIILVIVLLLFGVGRLGKLGAELGKGIRNFREALSGKQEASEEPKEEPKA
jgi:Sec-independent protein secretion pathway components